MLAGIIIGMNSIEAARCLESNDYLWTTIHLVIVMIAYLIETKEKK